MGNCGSCRSGKVINAHECYCKKSQSIVQRRGTCGEYRSGLGYYVRRRREMSRGGDLR